MKIVDFSALFSAANMVSDGSGTVSLLLEQIRSERERKAAISAHTAATKITMTIRSEREKRKKKNDRKNKEREERRDEERRKRERKKLKKRHPRLPVGLLARARRRRPFVSNIFLPTSLPPHSSYPS